MAKDPVVTKIEEAGYKTAMRGLSLNKEQPVENMPRLAGKLAFADAGSHRKFLRQIYLSWEIRISRKTWTEFDTYKVGVVRNSGSTMHNIHKRPFLITDFRSIFVNELLWLNQCWRRFKNGDPDMDLDTLKGRIPEDYLQTAVVSMNYEVLRTMYHDRKAHRLPEWPLLLEDMLKQIDHPELILQETPDA